MIVVNYSVFRANLKKYLQLAISERVVLQSNGRMFEIKPSEEVSFNPSPSNDPYFENAENIKDIEIGKQQIREGKSRSWREIKEELGL